MRNKLMKIMAACILASCIGCASTAKIGEHAEISGSPNALRALFDGFNGSLKTAKESDDASSEYFAARNIYEKEETKRAMPVSFWEKMKGGN